MISIGSPARTRTGTPSAAADFKSCSQCFKSAQRGGIIQIRSSSRRPIASRKCLIGPLVAHSRAAIGTSRQVAGRALS